MKKFSLGGITAEIQSLVLDIGLQIDSLKFEGGRINIGGDPPVTLEDRAAFGAMISQNSVASFLHKQAPGGLSGFKVQIEKGEMIVHAQATILLPIPVKAICTLEIVDKRQIFVKLKQASVIGGGAKSLVEGQLNKINPILDVAEMPFEAELESIRLEDSFITVMGFLTGIDLPETP